MIVSTSSTTGSIERDALGLYVMAHPCMSNIARKGERINPIYGEYHCVPGTVPRVFVIDTIEPSDFYAPGYLKLRGRDLGPL